MMRLTLMTLVCVALVGCASDATMQDKLERARRDEYRACMEQNNHYTDWHERWIVDQECKERAKRIRIKTVYPAVRVA